MNTVVEVVQTQMFYFPYICMGNDLFEFEDVEVWNFDEEADKRISDVPLRNYVSKLLKANTFHGRHIKNIGLITFKNNSTFKPLSRAQLNKVEEVRTLLFLLGVSNRNLQVGKNAGHFMYTADNFLVVGQNFKPFNSTTAYTSGGVIQIKASGHKVGEVKYERPPYVLENRFTWDKSLLSALKKIKRSKRKEYRRILRATDALRQGYYNNSDISMESRILDLARAFEILLELPESGQRKFFKEEIKKYSKGQKSRQITYRSERPGGKVVKEVGSVHTFWADRFYSLRNAIIHGDSISSGRFNFKGRRHLDLGVWYFVWALKMKLNVLLGSAEFYDQIVTENSTLKYDGREMYSIVLKALKKYK